MATNTLLPREDDKSAGTVAVIIFIAGACILVLLIILVLLFFKKRRSRHSKESTFIPRLERRGPNYGKLEDDEEGAWSADMGHDGMGGRVGGKAGMGYAPVHDESMGYQSQTLQHGEAGREGYR